MLAVWPGGVHCALVVVFVETVSGRTRTTPAMVVSAVVVVVVVVVVTGGVVVVWGGAVTGVLRTGVGQPPPEMRDDGGIPRRLAPPSAGPAITAASAA